MKRIVIIAGIVVFAGIFFLFPVRLAPERFLQAENLTDLTGGLLSGSEGKKYFFLNGSLGYLDDNWRVVSLAPDGLNYSGSDYYYTAYGPDTETFPVYLPSQVQISTINGAGTPLIFGRRLYIADYASGRLKAFSAAGQELWRYDIGAPITAFDSTEKLSIVGGIDGAVTILNREGRSVTDYRPGGSRIEAIYGAGLSSNGRYAAIVSGLDPQRFVLLKKGDKDYMPIYHKSLAKEYRRTVRIAFSPDERFVFYEGPGQLFVYDIHRKQERSISYEGEIIAFESNIFAGFAGFLARNENQTSVYIISQDGSYPLLLSGIDAEKVSLGTFRQAALLGIGGSLLKIGWEGS